MVHHLLPETSEDENERGKTLLRNNFNFYPRQLIPQGKNLALVSPMTPREGHTDIFSLPGSHQDHNLAKGPTLT